MNMLHIIYIPFTGVGSGDGFRGQEWFKKRLDIFRNYTLRSLAGQTSKNFYLLISFRAQEETDPLLKDLEKHISDNYPDLPVFFSFNGLIYHDDKFGGGPWRTTKNLARLGRDIYRGRKVGWTEFMSVFQDRNKTLPVRLAATLDNLKACLPQSDWITFTRIDSDDMFDKSVVERIQVEQPGFKKALVMKNGYVLNLKTKEVASWRPKTNPPFHTIFFPAEFFYSVKRHLEYMNGFRSHEDIPKLFSCTTLSDFLYCVTVHGSHISTIWDHPFRDKELPPLDTVIEVFEKFSLKI
jgi:hypothetical protein